MNQQETLLPAAVASSARQNCDVLIIGAGPAGSAAARVLAQHGLHVVLADQHEFPREKVCGDGLIPDAHKALARLGLLDAVMAKAQACAHVACIGPRGGRVDVPGEVAVLPRAELDLILFEGACAAGAQALVPARMLSMLEDAQGRVSGARLRQGQSEFEINAGWTILATGAAAQPLIASGMCTRQVPHAMALRGYVKNPAMVGHIKALEGVWHKKLRPGYGWIFPCREGVFNIGVGLVHSHDAGHKNAAKHSMKDVNLRHLFDAFCEFYAPARELMAGGQMLGPLKGAPLRCSLEGARWSRPGLLVAGEAAGSTYSFTGEGIGKALETGMLAAETIIANRENDENARSTYEAALHALKPRFALYERANKVNEHPWLADLLIWRANKNPALVRRMSGVLDETSNPGSLVSLRGIAKLFMPAKSV